MTEEMSRAKVIAAHADAHWTGHGMSGLRRIVNGAGEFLGWNWEQAASRLPAEPMADPVEIDKSEGLNMTAFAAAPDPSELVIDEKFTLWRDEEGDYIIQATERQQRGHFLVADGRTPEDAVWRMRQLLEMSDVMDPKEAAPEAAGTAKCQVCGYDAYLVTGSNPLRWAHDLPHGIITYSQHKDLFPQCWNNARVNPEPATEGAIDNVANLKEQVWQAWLRNDRNMRLDVDALRPDEPKAEGAEKEITNQTILLNTATSDPTPIRPTVTRRALFNQPKYPAGRTDAYMDALESRNDELQIQLDTARREWQFNADDAVKAEREVERLLELVEAIDATLCSCRHSSAQSAVGCNCDIHAVHRLIKESSKAESYLAAQKEGE